jgi:hypothetical protein
MENAEGDPTARANLTEQATSVCRKTDSFNIPSKDGNKEEAR